MALESSQSEEIQRPKMIGFALVTTEYNSYLKGFLAALKDQTTFFTLIINHCYNFIERLKI